MAASSSSSSAAQAASPQLGIELRIDGQPLDDENREIIASQQAQYEEHRAEIEEQNLAKLEGNDKGADKGHLAADATGGFARLRHRNSFFVADVKKAAEAEGLPHPHNRK